MNKFTYAITLGAGLVLSLAAPTVQAAPIVQSLTTANLSASQFDSLFTPVTTVLSQNYSFENTGTAGVVQSQVFQGTGADQGLFAYAYQFKVNNATDVTTGEATSVNSASMLFNATPVAANLTGSGSSPSPSAYVITSGAIGSLSAPVAGSGSGIQTPSQIVWQPGTTTGSLTFQYLNPTTGTGPLAAGATSGTIVVLSTQAFSQQNVFVSLQNPEPQNGYPVAWSPTTGPIEEVPAPEPATVLAWGSVIAALAVGQRFRGSHKVSVA
jgi:hypothetical protein